MDKVELSFSDELAKYNASSSYSFIIILLCILLATTIFILSIGLLNNSTRILIEENLRSLFLLRILGTKKKFTSRIIYIESLLSILFGILLSTLLIIFLLPAVDILGKLFLELLNKSILNSVKNTFIYDSGFYWYIPFITLMYYYTFSVIFIKINLGRIYKMNRKRKK